MTRTDFPPGTRQLRVGDLVEVRSEAEIRLTDDWTEQMLDLPSGCIVLGGAPCTGLHHGRCTRRTDAYWRETWLEREALQRAVPEGVEG